MRRCLSLTLVLATASVLSVTTFTASAVAAAPQAPVLTLSGTTLTWKALPGVSTYELATISNPTTTRHTTYQTVTGTSFTPPAVPSQTVGYGLAANVANAPWAKEVTITWPAPPPPAPVLTLSGTTLTWNALAGVSSYQLATISNPTTTRNTTYQTVTGTSFSPPAVPGQKVNYGLEASVANAPWATEVTITWPAAVPVAPAPPAPPAVPVAPGAPVLTVSGTTLTWQALPGVSSYQLATISNPTTTRNTTYQTVTGTSFSPPAVPGQKVNYGLQASVANAPWATEVTITWPSASATGRLAGDQFYVDPADSAVSEVRSLTASGQVSQANALGVIASEPEAVWFTSAASASASAVSSLTGAAAAAGKVPVLVAYDLPWRDCGQFSSGGAATPAAYESFVDGMVSGIGQRKVVIIVEPDALSELSCLPASEQQSYYQLLHYAALRLSSDANAAVYVDAGHTGWQSAAVEASGVSQVLAGTNAAGFAVNVSNFVSTAADMSYGTAISQLAGGRHFVIDTSRNAGSVPAGQWCNPPGARLGQAPTTVTGNPLVDADLWIKTPGESDGTCNGGPSAGAFWLSYALQLVS
jgi:endoglucanase